MSYTKYAHKMTLVSSDTLDLSAGAGASAVQVAVEIRNVGLRAGDECVLLFASPPSNSTLRGAPKQQLVAFDRVHLEPKNMKRVVFDLDPAALRTIVAAGTRGLQPQQEENGNGVSYAEQWVLHLGSSAAGGGAGLAVRLAWHAG